MAVRSKAGPLVVQWEAAVSSVEPGSQRWDEVTPLLAAERLNAASVQDLPGQWAATSTVLQLSPAT
ncbi:MAG: hypothetical protein H7323_02190 [Frankiales bacterium]|nr:hypothetical protein [Frankiales bacterium]